MTEKKRIFLFNPPVGKYSRDGRCQMDTDTMTAQPERIPIELCYIAAQFIKNGFEAKIVDYPLEKKGWDDFIADIKSFRPDYSLFSITTFTLDKDMKAAELIKEHLPDSKIIVKGEHLCNNDLEALEKYPSIDIAMRNEVEEIAGNIASGKRLESIKGITFRKKGKIIRNEDAPWISDLDSLPFPARHLLNKYAYLRPDTKEPLTVVMTGRGCPYRCIYCTVPKISKLKIRQRDYKKVVDEIEECVNKEGIRNFFFLADTFTFYEQWIVDFCQEIINRNLKIEWGCNSRVDTFSDKRAGLMKKAGCYVVGFGIESGNSETLDKIRKNTTLESAENAIALCKRYKLKSYMLFMIGFPWETKEMVEDTLRFARKLDGDFLDINIAYPFNDTEMYDLMKADNLFDSNELAGHDVTRPVVRTRYLSTQDLLKLKRKGILRFYLRPSYVLRTLASIRSPKVLVNYGTKGFNMIFSQFKLKKID